jgi:hypothetical protein
MRCRSVTISSLLLGAAFVGSYLVADRASAAMWAVLTVSPERPTVGEPAEVLIRTFGTYGPDAIDAIAHDGPIPAPRDLVLVLWAVEYPFQLVAIGPKGESVEVDVHRDEADASLYRGEVSFPTSGDWTLQLPQFPGPEDAPGIRLAVDVADRAPPFGAVAFLAIAAAIGALASAAAIGLMRRRATSGDVAAR